MKREVREYHLTGENRVLMPEKAKILNVGARFLPDGPLHPVICMWAMVNPEAPEFVRKFLVLETGEDLPYLFSLQYIGTVVHTQFVVRHVFEVAS